ncbi:CRP-like cAMP-binding protein [Desulfobaculum xiamenense]|uniref:CRP-like cAMP-binding protein n=1 Tax=Desulfobaculum xiamenense TaxID=995050 RepID=A0A846QSQ1_9BACT|nr:cyclic nucleotide-binding domain-containing protein [Desulfobaculum xiamenense]NJB69393.1 CRP-like cAMP-binding protein [Desulfobaculum xiamenense]
MQIDERGMERFVVSDPGGDVIERLGDIPFFEVFAASEARQKVLASGAWLRCPAGERVVREGEAGHDFFVVVEGRVRIAKGGRPLDELTRGAVFGEMGALMHEPRTADVETVEPSLLFRMHVTALSGLDLSVVFPLMVHFYRIAARRLARADSRLAMV